jgi:hypothetical protein
LHTAARTGGLLLAWQNFSQVRWTGQKPYCATLRTIRQQGQTWCGSRPMRVR